MFEDLSRRSFLGMTAVAGGTLLAGGMITRPLQAVQGTGWPEMPIIKVYVVYLGLGGAWPKPDFDAPKEIKIRHIGNCLKADPAYGEGVANALGISMSDVPK